MPRPKVISFDGDDTLWDFTASQNAGLAAVREVLQSLGANPDSMSIERMVAVRQQAGDELAEAGASLLELRWEGLHRVAAEAGIEATEAVTDRLFETYMAVREGLTLVYDDVRPALDHLVGDGWTVALLSNGNTALESAGLQGYFRVALYAEEIGFRKPESAAFGAVATAAGCDLRDLVHVGDSLENDVIGAGTSGATAIWLNRHRQIAKLDNTPFHQIRSLAELPQVLDLLDR